jgi:protease I
MMRSIILTSILLFTLVLFLATGCAEAPITKEVTQDEEVVSVSGKKILMIIAPDGFRDEEFLEPKQVFDNAGASVTVASKGVKTAKGKLGATANVDVDISAVNATDYDAVVFVGGPGTTVYFDDPAAHKIAKDSFTAGKLTAAICIAPSILANAGVLKGKKATAFESESDNIDAKSAGYTGRPITVDGNIVTANGPAVAKDFGEEIIKLLS